jgi:hypothetical protein
MKFSDIDKELLPYSFTKEEENKRVLEEWVTFENVLRHGLTREQMLNSPDVPEIDKQLFRNTKTFDFWIAHEYIQDCPQNIDQYNEWSERSNEHMINLENSFLNDGVKEPGTVWSDVAMLLAGHHRRYVCKHNLETKGFVYCISRSDFYVNLTLQGPSGLAKIEELLVEYNMRPDRELIDLFESIESIRVKKVEAGEMDERQWEEDGRTVKGREMNELIRKHPMSPKVYRAMMKIRDGWTYEYKGKTKGGLINGKSYFIPGRNKLNDLWGSVSKKQTEDGYRAPVSAAKNQLDDWKLQQQAVTRQPNEVSNEVLGVNSSTLPEWLSHTLNKVIESLDRTSEQTLDDGFGGTLSVGDALFDNNGMANTFHRLFEKYAPVYLEKCNGIKSKPTVGNEHLDFESLASKITKYQTIYCEWKFTSKGVSITSNLPKFTTVLTGFIDGTNYKNLIIAIGNYTSDHWTHSQGRPQLTKKVIYENATFLVGSITKEKRGKKEILKLNYENK